VGIKRKRDGGRESLPTHRTVRGQGCEEGAAWAEGGRGAGEALPATAGAVRACVGGVWVCEGLGARGGRRRRHRGAGECAAARSGSNPAAASPPAACPPVPTAGLGPAQGSCGPSLAGGFWLTSPPAIAAGTAGAGLGGLSLPAPAADGASLAEGPGWCARALTTSARCRRVTRTITRAVTPADARRGGGGAMTAG
jgi:hypothetical protein